MSEWLPPRQFSEADGIDDWRVLANGASAHFTTDAFATGVALADAIGALADAADRYPDVDLRATGVTVRLTADPDHGLSRLDLELARQISAAAGALGAPADPAAVQEVQVSIDALSIPAVRAFWRAVLGYREVGEEDLLDPRGHGPSFWFQVMDEPRPQRSRVHVDVLVPHDQAEARVAAAIEAGGRLVTDEHAPSWWTLADREGNEVDVASWAGRD
jgi:4a-hydroxytetrahydrobiopterin dehydratase